MDKSIQELVQPQIVGIGTLYDLDMVSVACEGIIICIICQGKIIDGVIALLSSFYTFNIS